MRSQGLTLITVLTISLCISRLWKMDLKRLNRAAANWDISGNKKPYAFLSHSFTESDAGQTSSSSYCLLKPCKSARVPHRQRLTGFCACDKQMTDHRRGERNLSIEWYSSTVSLWNTICGSYNNHGNRVSSQHTVSVTSVESTELKSKSTTIT